MNVQQCLRLLRYYIVFLSDDLGGKVACEWIESTVNEFMTWKRTHIQEYPIVDTFLLSSGLGANASTRKAVAQGTAGNKMFNSIKYF